MASKRVGRNAEEQALFDYQDAGQAFVDGGAAQYETGNPYDYTKLGPLGELGPSAYEGIQTDQRYKDFELDALAQLEEQSKNGYTARDKADLAKIENNANRANKGRQDALKQSMMSRGIGGGGLEVVMAQQAAQDAAEQQALASLEKNAQMQDRKQQATSQLGQLSNQLQTRDFSQQAQKAQAADSISRFNTQNSNQVQMQNNQGMNNANMVNYERSNQVRDNNVNAGYNYRKDAMGVQQGNAQTAYNHTQDQKNYELAKKAAKAKKSSGFGALAGAVAGGAIGTFVAPGLGTAAGAQLGSSIGGSFANGGRIHGPEVSPFDDPANDIIPVNVSAGEVILPKSVASDPQAAAQFVAKENAKSGLDPRILERLSGKNPDLINKYKAQMDGANQGIEQADKMKSYGDIANTIGKVATDFGNSQREDTIYHNSWDKMGNAPQIQKAEQREYDGSLVDKLGAEGQSKAQQRLAQIKAQMAEEIKTQRQGDEFALGRADKADAEAKAQAKFDAEQAYKREKDAKDYGLKEKELAQRSTDRQSDNEYRNAMLGATMQRNQLDTDMKKLKYAEEQNKLNIPGYDRTGEVTPTDNEAMKARDAVGTLNSFKAGMKMLQDRVQKNGSFEWGGTKGNEMEALAGDLRMQAKTLYELGVLNGPDLGLILKQIPDTSSLGAMFTSDKSVGKTLETTSSAIDRQVQEKLKSKGYAPKAEAKQPTSAVDYDSMSDEELERLLKGK